MKYKSVSIVRDDQNRCFKVEARWDDGDWMCGGIVATLYATTDGIVYVKEPGHRPIRVFKDDAALHSYLNSLSKAPVQSVCLKS